MSTAAEPDEGVIDVRPLGPALAGAIVEYAGEDPDARSPPAGPRAGPGDPHPPGTRRDNGPLPRGQDHVHRVRHHAQAGGRPDAHPGRRGAPFARRLGGCVGACHKGPPRQPARSPRRASNGRAFLRGASFMRIQRYRSLAAHPRGRHAGNCSLPAMGCIRPAPGARPVPRRLPKPPRRTAFRPGCASPTTSTSCSSSCSIRSGLQILMDHPRLYWNVHCTPGTEWLRLTPIEVPDGPGLDGQGRRPLPLALDRPARLPAHHRHGPALALPQRAVLGGQRPDLRGPAVRHRPVAATRADLLAGRARRLGRLRPLRHLPPSAGAGRLLPLQRAPAVGLLRAWCSSWHPWRS